MTSGLHASAPPSNALSSSVGLKVDFDMAVLVLASGLYRLMAIRTRSYHQVFRELIDMLAISPSPNAKSPFASTAAPISRAFLASDLFNKSVSVRWWKGPPVLG